MDSLTSLFIFNDISTRMLFRAVNHWASKSLNINMWYWLWERQFLSHKDGYTNLISCNVRVWRNNTSCTEVDSFSHHFHAEHALFPFKQLSQSRLFSVCCFLSHWWVHEWIYGILKLDPLLHCFSLSSTACSMMSVRIIPCRLKEQVFECKIKIKNFNKHSWVCM
jgi:hypothetical protein